MQEPHAVPTLRYRIWNEALEFVAPLSKAPREGKLVHPSARPGVGQRHLAERTRVLAPNRAFAKICRVCGLKSREEAPRSARNREERAAREMRVVGSAAARKHARVAVPSP